MADFKVGDVVYLKSGSPKLTVTSKSFSDGNQTITTRWVQKDEMVQATFPAECLTDEPVAAVAEPKPTGVVETALAPVESEAKT